MAKSYVILMDLTVDLKDTAWHESWQEACMQQGSVFELTSKA